jgi:hypothetical protein
MPPIEFKLMHFSEHGAPSAVLLDGIQRERLMRNARQRIGTQVTQKSNPAKRTIARPRDRDRVDQLAALLPSSG